MLLEVFGSLPETSISSRESYFSKVDHIRRKLACGIQLVSPWSCGWPLWGPGNTLFRVDNNVSGKNPTACNGLVLFIVVFNFCYSIFLAKSDCSGKSRAHRCPPNLFPRAGHSHLFSHFKSWTSGALKTMRWNKLCLLCTGATKFDSKMKTRNFLYIVVK